MNDKDKVITGLEHCSEDGCQGCPYEKDCRACDGFSLLAKDALELINYQDQHIEAFLKDQEPRLLKLEEVKAFGWDYCYLEEERLPGKEYRAVCGNYALTCITWPCVASMRIQHGDDSYGRKWRCWTAKPTEEQRKAVKWDG